jgi:acetyl-CoA synthetase
MARTIWRNHQRYKETYFSAYENIYFTGDGALRDTLRYYRITGRVDDVIIVSGHNLGTAPIEDAINEHPAVAESAIVGFPHDVKGNALYGYITLKEIGEGRDHDNLRKEINQIITEHIGPIAKLDKMQFTNGLPKTRSGKIMRRILRKIASNETDNLGDTSTLLNPEVVQEIMDNVKLIHSRGDSKSPREFKISSDTMTSSNRIIKVLIQILQNITRLTIQSLANSR